MEIDNRVNDVSREYLDIITGKTYIVPANSMGYRMGMISVFIHMTSWQEDRPNPRYHP